jgi:hypothetical protein
MEICKRPRRLDHLGQFGRGCGASRGKRQYNSPSRCSLSGRFGRHGWHTRDECRPHKYKNGIPGLKNILEPVVVFKKNTYNSSIDKRKNTKFIFAMKVLRDTQAVGDGMNIAFFRASLVVHWGSVRVHGSVGRFSSRLV